MAKTNKHRRAGSPGKPGRHPAKDPKRPVLFYVEESIIKANGGVAECREVCQDFLNKRVAAQFLTEFLKPQKKALQEFNKEAREAIDNRGILLKPGPKKPPIIDPSA